MLCKECYVEQNRITPLLNPRQCLEEHTQYVCGTCGRCICIEHTQRGLQRWNFPFKSLEIAKLYLRSADFSTKKACSIYEIKSEKGRVFYKIFADEEDLKIFLKKNKDKSCDEMKPLFSMDSYEDFPNTKVKRLDMDEVEKYLSER
jgi:hypothetical protein